MISASDGKLPPELESGPFLLSTPPPGVDPVPAPAQDDTDAISPTASPPSSRSTSGSRSPRLDTALFDRRQLLAFISLAQTASFTASARELGVSQSAISHSIGELERRIGCRLFERTSRRVLLTLAGEHFLHHASRIRLEMDSALEALGSIRTWGQIQLRVAAPASVCEDLMPACILEVRTEHPHARISLGVADRDEALASLAAGRVDIAVCLGQEPDERFDCEPLFEDELVFAMAPDHPWATQAPTQPAAIGSEPLLTYRRNTYTWRLLVDRLAKEGIQPTIILDCDSITAIRQMAMLRMGVAVIARWAIAPQIASGQLACQSLTPRPLIRKWGAFHLRSRRLSSAQSLLIQELRRTSARQMVPPQRTPYAAA